MAHAHRIDPTAFETLDAAGATDTSPRDRRNPVEPQPAERLERVAARVRADAIQAPQRYLRESVVPEGGE